MNWGLTGETSGAGDWEFGYAGTDTGKSLMVGGPRAKDGDARTEWSTSGWAEDLMQVQAQWRV